GGRDEGGQGEVVVTDVVRRDLVVPAQPAGGSVRHEQRVGVERSARICAAVWVLRRATPRQGIGDAPENSRAGNTRCPPGPASACLCGNAPSTLDRVELPALLPGRRVESVERSPPVRRLADCADVNRAAGDLRRDVDVASRRRGEEPAPEQTARCLVEREGEAV